MVKKMRKRRKKKRFHTIRTIILGFLALCVLTAIFDPDSSKKPAVGDGSDLVESGSVSVEPVEEPEEPQKPQKPQKPTVQYRTYIDWAMLQSYVCAVEIDDFDGDIIEAGTWTVEETGTHSFAKNPVPIVWDIYISDKLYQRESQLKSDEYIGSVGGFGSEGQVWEFDVEAGKYLYIKYTRMAGTPVGTLHLEKK